MKDVKGYIERLDHSMTKKEKLFFLKKINVQKYDYIVDFGCANGRLLYEIDKHIGKRKCNAEFIGVDNNPQLEIAYTYNHKFARVSSLDEIGELNGNVLLILSSVLHELDFDTLFTLIQFISKSVDTVSIRDMYFQENKSEYSDILQYLEINNMLFNEQFWEIYWRNKTAIEVHPYAQSLYEFFLKYTYTQNWETEVKENYFSGLAKRFIDSLTNTQKVLYCKHYILPYKKEQVLKDFGYKMKAKTHIKLIVQIGRQK